MEGKKSEFKAFDRVLVRDLDGGEWLAAFYDKYSSDVEKFPHRMIGCTYFAQCIPYEGHEHLLGTTDSPEKPRRWKPKNGEMYYSAAWGHSVGFTPTGMIWHGGLYDESVWRFGNCFRTEEEARWMCDRLNKAVSRLMTPNDEGHEAGED